MISVRRTLIRNLLFSRTRMGGRESVTGHGSRVGQHISLRSQPVRDHGKSSFRNIGVSISRGSAGVKQKINRERGSVFFLWTKEITDVIRLKI